MIRKIEFRIREWIYCYRTRQTARGWLLQACQVETDWLNKL